MAKYLTQEGAQLIINDYNNKLGLKADASDLSSFVTANEASNFATKSYVGQQIAGIVFPVYDDTALEARVTSLEGNVQGIYHYKGSVADADALAAIQNPAVGDTYNVADTGMNAAWNGTAWDDFGAIVDLSDYVRTSDVQAMTRAEVNAILFSGKTAIVSNLESMQAVLDNDQPEVEVTLNDDLLLTQPISIPEGKKVTLNLGENNITSSSLGMLVEGEVELVGGSIDANSYGVNVVDGGKLTINGTNISSAVANGVSATGPNSEIVIESGNITAQEYGVGAYHGATITVNGGYLKGLDNFGLGGNGSPYYDTVQKKFVNQPNENTVAQAPVNVTVNGGTIEGQIVSAGYIATAIYWPCAGTLTLNDCTVKGAAGIVQRGGTVNIGEGTTIIANGETGVLGKAGDSKVTVGPYAVVYDKSANYPDAANMALNIASSAVLTGTDGDICKLPADAAGVTDNRTGE